MTFKPQYVCGLVVLLMMFSFSANAFQDEEQVVTLTGEVEKALVFASDTSDTEVNVELRLKLTLKNDSNENVLFPIRAIGCQSLSFVKRDGGVLGRFDFPGSSRLTTFSEFEEARKNKNFVGEWIRLTSKSHRSFDLPIKLRLRKKPRANNVGNGDSTVLLEPISLTELKEERPVYFQLLCNTAPDFFVDQNAVTAYWKKIGNEIGDWALITSPIRSAPIFLGCLEQN